MNSCQLFKLIVIVKIKSRAHACGCTSVVTWINNLALINLRGGSRYVTYLLEVEHLSKRFSVCTSSRSSILTATLIVASIWSTCTSMWSCNLTIEFVAQHAIKSTSQGWTMRLECELITVFSVSVVLHGRRKPLIGRTVLKLSMARRCIHW
jgi:hypothetical protein